MEGQGVAASSPAAAGRQGEPGPGAVAPAEFGHPAETFVTSGITDGGEGREHNGDDSHVLIASGHPGASSRDDGVPQSPDSSPPPRPPGEKPSSREPGGKASQESRTEFSSQQIKSDKADNIGDPGQNNGVVAKDGNTGHNQAAGGLAPPAADSPAVDTPAADSPAVDAPAADSPAVDAPAADSPAADDSAAAAPPGTSEPKTVQFAAIPPDNAEPDNPEPDDAEPEPAQPATSPDDEAAAETGEPETEQFAAIPPEGGRTVIIPEPVARPAGAAAEPAETEPEPTPAPTAAARPPASQGHVRVDARLLEAALLNLRKRIAAIPLVFQIAGSAEVKAERTKLLSQIDDYLLPRVRRSAAPILVALVGSTGAGKSTLVNSIVGAHVSATGVRRPTTNSPVLACHPDEIDWFAENNFLPTLPRVRQEGLARAGRDGLLVLAASEGMPRGIALLDTPDIDSVVQAHHEFALQFLDASDLWLFMTSASRYADGPVWEILQHARDRKASLGVVLSRIPQAYRTELVDHFNAMLDANGIAAADRFVIQETPLIDGMLPPDAYQPVRDWLADTAARSDRRVAVLSQTMSGVLDTFKSRVPAIAAHVEAQVVLRAQLRQAAETAYQNAFAEASGGLKDGTLLRGEVLARWEDCMVGGELRPRRGGARAAKGVPKKGKRARRGPSRPAALNAALRSAIESYIVSVADRAAEAVEGSWRADPAGAVLLAAAAAERARDVRAKQVFESVFGPAGQSGGGDLADMDIKTADVINAADAAKASAFSRSSADLALRSARAVGAWQDHLARMAEGGNLRPAVRRVSFDEEALSLVVLVAMLGESAPRAAAAPGEAGRGSVYTEPREMLTSVFGAVMLTEILAKARADLTERVRLLLDEELVRFVEVIDAAGDCDDVAAIRLYQAEFSLEAVR
jgi:energy-coupling factor transporter ATP-binding protein EcfA2